MAWPLLVNRLTSECNFQYLLTATSRIQNGHLEYHFGLYRQMPGTYYHITYTQILESERRLQLSNTIIKLFSLKLSFGEGLISLKNYLNTFVENVSDQDLNSD